MDKVRFGVVGTNFITDWVDCRSPAGMSVLNW